MPTYEYECDRCQHRFEEFQPITAAPLTKCPACKKKALRRLLGAGAGVIFKGSGFYQTDYRSDSYKKAAEAEKPAAAASSDAKQPGAKPDAPATKADTSSAGAPATGPDSNAGAAKTAPESKRAGDSRRRGGGGGSRGAARK
ncbi:Zinc ribbon domain protein [Phycisphaerae bacterium RAS1]|nr:Zinc ribbon domain protein [Phycisphaerae bacterium RAS1]